MKDTVALERLAALHAGSGDAATFCQLCLRGEGDDGVRVASLGRLCAARAHLTCADCVSSIADAARPSASAASPAWGAIAGCPTCALPDTDAGVTRLFRRGRDASLPPGARSEAPEGPVAADRSSSALMTRDSLSRADVEALAGVLVAERARRLREDDDASASSSSSSSSADDDETDADPSGPTSWWPRRDVAAQLRSALGALPSLNALRTAAPGIFADLAVVSNGSALLGSGAGAEIDAHSCVARFNEYEIGGAFAEDVGERVDVHATGWLMAAARDDPKDRLAAEEEEGGGGGGGGGGNDRNSVGNDRRSAGSLRRRTRGLPLPLPRAPARRDPAHAQRPGARARVLRLVFARDSVPPAAVEQPPPRKNASSERTSDASLSDADAWWLARTRRKGPLVLAASPEAYGRHWAHVLATRASRATARVTSGYLFLLLALDLAGQDEPPPAEAEAPPEARDDDGARRATATLPLRPAPGPSAARARLGVLPPPPRGSLCTGSRTTLGTRRTPRGGTTSTGCTSSATTCTTSRGSARRSPRSSPGGPTPSPERRTYLSPLMRGSESVDDEGRSVV